MGGRADGESLKAAKCFFFHSVPFSHPSSRFVRRHLQLQTGEARSRLGAATNAAGLLLLPMTAAPFLSGIFVKLKK